MNFEILCVSASHWLKSFKSLQVILSLAHFVKSVSRIALKSPVEPKKYHQAIFSIHTCREFLQHQKSIAVFTTVFQGLKYASLIRYVTMYATLFENYSKCRISIFEFWHFLPIFVLLKLTCLVTLFDRKLQVFRNSPKWTILST